MLSLRVFPRSFATISLVLVWESYDCFPQDIVVTHASRRLAIPPLHDEERSINPNLIGVDAPYNYTN